MLVRLMHMLTQARDQDVCIHPMDLYLIRHGETVDNVAGNYAGVRDSALTNHGVDQARRLGEYFAKENIVLTNIYASPLTRASKTAEAIRAKQSSVRDQDKAACEDFEIVKVPDLIEQNFGFYEGKPCFARSEGRKSGREVHNEKHKNDDGFEDVESKESMNRRADAFLDEHLLPLLTASDGSHRLVVAVVSHGMLLSRLWKRLLLRLPRKSVTIAAEVTAARGDIILEHPGGWSNTGYMQLSFHPAITAQDSQDAAVDSAFATDATTAVRPTLLKMHLTLHGWTTTIVGIDRKEHLTGLKRQRGGIGRSAYDAGQMKLDGFFKKQRTI